MKGQNTYKDLEGRFSLELPEGWKLNTEQMNMVYAFGDPESSASITMAYMESSESLDELTGMYVETVLGLDGGILPPAGSVVDMTVNGAMARWIEYPFNMGTEYGDVRINVYIGALLDDQNRGIAFFSVLNDNTREQFEESVKNSFATMQLHDLPLSGIENVREVEVDYSSLGETPVIPASVFEHNLFTVDVPEGWRSEQGSGDILVTLSREGSSTCTLSIMGKKKNQFGDSREEILFDIMDGMIQGIPSMKKVSGPNELTTDLGETISVEEYRGDIDVSGQIVTLGAILASAKNNDRGLGFMCIYSIDIRDIAARETETILKSIR